LAIVEQFPECQRGAEVQLHVLAVDQDRERPSQPAGDLPTVGGEHLPEAETLARGASPENAYRQQLDLLVGISAALFDQGQEGRFEA
jgi:hypothetical protein